MSIRETLSALGAIATVLLLGHFIPMPAQEGAQLAVIPFAVLAGLGAAGGFLQSRGAGSQQRRQNNLLQGIASSLTPQNVFGNIPDFQINRQLLNAPLSQIDRGALQSQLSAQGQIGRSGGAGGIASLLPLAAGASRTQGRAGVLQQFGQLQAQFDFQQQQAKRQQALQLAQLRAGILSGQQQPISGSSIFGNAITGGLGAFGGFQQQNQLLQLLQQLQGGGSEPATEVSGQFGGPSIDFSGLLGGGGASLGQPQPQFGQAQGNPFGAQQVFNPQQGLASGARNQFFQQPQFGGAGPFR